MTINDTYEDDKYDDDGMVINMMIMIKMMPRMKESGFKSGSAARGGGG